MSLSHLVRGLLGFVKETFTDGVKTLTSKEGLKRLYGASLYRNAIYLMLNSAVTAVFGFVFWILAARFYSAEEVGLASAVIAVASFLAMLSTLGLDYGLIRFIPNSGKKFNSLVNSCFTVSGLAAIVFSLLFLAGLNIWSPALIFLWQSPLYLGSFVVLVVAWAPCLLLNNVFIAQRRANFTLFQAISNGFTKLALVIPLAASLYALGIITSLGIGFVVAIMVGLLLLLPRLQSGYHPSVAMRKQIINEMAHFSLANYTVNIVWRIPYFVLPLIIINLLGAEQNAYYYIAYTIATALFIIPVGTSFSLFAEGSHIQEGLGNYVRKSLKFSLLILIPAIIVIFLAGDKILLLFGEAYSEEATRLLWILALTSLPVAINDTYFTMKRVEKKMKSVIGLTSLAVALILGLSCLLLPVTGIIGVGIAFITGHSILALVILGNWLIKERQKSKEILRI